MQRKKLISFLFCLVLLCTGFMPEAAQSSNKSSLLGKPLAMQSPQTDALTNAASVSFSSSTTQLNAQPKLNLTITNHGTAKISSINYT